MCVVRFFLDAKVANNKECIQLAQLCTVMNVTQTTRKFRVGGHFDVNCVNKTRPIRGEMLVYYNVICNLQIIFYIRI